MKRLLILILLLAIAGSVQAATIGVWKTGSGLWSDGSRWNTTTPAGSPPAAPTSGSDEIKIQAAGTVTIDGTPPISSYDCRITTGNAAGTVAINIVTGANFTLGEFRVGAKVSATAGGIATATQTAGILTVGDLVLGRGSGTSTTDSVIGNGSYTISGGTLGVTGTTNYANGGRLYVGAGNNSATGSVVANLVGTFTVDGAGGTILTNKLYVGSDNGGKFGTGNLAFNIVNGAVSKVQVGTSGNVYLDAGSTGVANLVLSANGALGAGNIVLVEQTGTAAVNGIFDQLNGVVGAATQGAAVVLGGKSYTLSYVYDATTGIDGAGNDIALVVPEPATLAVLGLGGLLLRRRRLA
jgi:hypothetical protein